MSELDLEISHSQDCRLVIPEGRFAELSLGSGALIWAQLSLQKNQPAYSLEGSFYHPIV